MKCKREFGDYQTPPDFATKVCCYLRDERNITASVVTNINANIFGFEWRQGVKHDCSKVMELSVDGSVLKNGQGETVDIEDDIIFPLIKSSMFKMPIIFIFDSGAINNQ